MKDIQDLPWYSIFQLLQLLWEWYDRVRYYLLWENEIYFYYISCCTEICLQKCNNALPDFYFVCDKSKQQVELILPGFNEEKFMEFLYGVRHVTEKILKKTQKIGNSL